jgi:hypothetical protein
VSPRPIQSPLLHTLVSNGSMHSKFGVAASNVLPILFHTTV